MSTAEPPARPLGGPDTPMEGRCGARTRAGGYCAQRPALGRARCKFHGGATPRGIASVHFRHGARSIALPQRMRASYEEALQDPDLLSLRVEIATHRAIADDLRRRLADSESAGGRGLQTAWRDFRSAHRAGNAERMADALTLLQAAIEGRVAEDSLRRELRHEDELIQKFLRAENDRLEQLHQMVSREQALTYMRSLAIGVKEAVDTCVSDPGIRSEILRTVSTRFEELNGGRGAPHPVAGRRALDGAVDPEADD